MAQNKLSFNEKKIISVANHNICIWIPNTLATPTCVAGG